MKPVEWRIQARNDAAQAAYWYARQAGLPLGERFLTEVDATLERISRNPVIGSPRHSAFVPGLPAPLRFLPVRHFERYLVYYIDLPERIEAIRIWDASRGLDLLMDSDE